MAFSENLLSNKTTLTLGAQCCPAKKLQIFAKKFGPIKNF
jgi:hypothetical protein